MEITTEYLDKKIKLNKTIRRYVNIPCLFISFFVFFMGVLVSDPNHMLLGVLLIVMNTFNLLLANFSIRKLEEARAMLAGLDRVKKINELYGR